MTILLAEPRPKPLENLQRNEENGWVLEDGRRIISFRLRTFHAAMDDLALSAGATVAEVLLLRMGSAIGQASMIYSKDEIKSDDDLGKVFDESLRCRGWGRCLSMRKRVGEGETVYVFTCRGTLCSYERKAEVPTCHLTRGMIVGALEVLLGRKAMMHAETQCESTGAQDCVFEVTFPTEAK